MAENDEILNHLKTVNKKLDEMQRTVTAIDVSIQGDENRGVVGMRQHIRKIRYDFDEHVKKDSLDFLTLADGQAAINKKADSVKWWLLGAGAVFSAIGWVVTHLDKFPL